MNDFYLQPNPESSRFPPQAEALLLDLLRSTLGAHARLASYTILKSAYDYIVVSAKLEHPTIQVIIKLAGPDAALPCPFDRTAALHHLLRARTAAPVPEVLAADVSYSSWPVRYMIKTFAPGVEWVAARTQMNPQELDDAYRQIGEAVAQLHTLTFPSFGELSADLVVEQGTPLTEALLNRARLRIPNPAHAELFTSLLNDRAALFSATTQPRLCHEDLHGHNMIFERENGRWQLSAMLDFDSAWAGHHESDLARLELWRGMTGTSFWSAYLASHPLDDLYPQRRPIYQLLWCLEYASPSPQHLADTQRVCAELGIQPVQFA